LKEIFFWLFSLFSSTTEWMRRLWACQPQGMKIVLGGGILIEPSDDLSGQAV